MHRTPRSVCLLFLALVGLPLVAGAASVTLLPAAPGDLAGARELTAASPDFAGPAVSHDPVRFSWAVDRSAELALRPQPAVASSRQYWLHATAAQLAEGVVLATTAPAALVRVNPADGAAERALDPAALRLTAPDGRVWRDGEGMELIADAAAVAKSDTPFVAGTAAFRLRGDLGAGRYLLQAPTAALPPETLFVIHVLEPASPIVAELRSDRVDALAGSPVTVRLQLADDGRPLDPSQVSGDLINPSGERRPLAARAGRDGATLLTARPGTARVPGLWEVEAHVVGKAGGLEVRRDVRTAFAAAVPSARLGETAVVERGADGLSASFAVETASEGRYEVRAVLWGTDAAGTLVPAAVGAAADWLPVGNGNLRLEFAPELYDGLHAPFELRDLQLNDQGRMGVLHRQARAAVLD